MTKNDQNASLWACCRRWRLNICGVANLLPSCTHTWHIFIYSRDRSFRIARVCYNNFLSGLTYSLFLFGTQQWVSRQMALVYVHRFSWLANLWHAMYNLIGSMQHGCVLKMLSIAPNWPSLIPTVHVIQDVSEGTLSKKIALSCFLKNVV